MMLKELAIKAEFCLLGAGLLYFYGQAAGSAGIFLKSLIVSQIPLFATRGLNSW